MVALDVITVNEAVPHIQAMLGFSGSSLEGPVSAYAHAFGGLLLGGRGGDILGRRLVLFAGMAVFSPTSLWAASPPHSPGARPGWPCGGGSPGRPSREAAGNQLTADLIHPPESTGRDEQEAPDDRTRHRHADAGAAGARPLRQRRHRLRRMALPGHQRRLRDHGRRAPR
jgi:hypothetical protein